MKKIENIFQKCKENVKIINIFQKNFTFNKKLEKSL